MLSKRKSFKKEEKRGKRMKEIKKIIYNTGKLGGGTEIIRVNENENHAW